MKVSVFAAYFETLKAALQISTKTVLAHEKCLLYSSGVDG